MLALKFYRVDEGIPRIYGRFVAIVVGIIELGGWTFDYSFWVEPKKRHDISGPYFDF